MGYAKPRDVHQEKIACDIAKLVALPVPEIRLAQIENMTGWHAVSVAFGSESLDLRKVRETTGIQPPLQTALAAASGLLALHAWFGTSDLKEDHVLVASTDQGAPCVAAIDFASAFAWAPADVGNVVYSAGEPKGLLENVDKAAVEAAVERIEALNDQQIGEALAAIPDTVLPPAERDRIKAGLIARRGKIRTAMQDRQWLP